MHLKVTILTRALSDCNQTFFKLRNEEEMRVLSSLIKRFCFLF